MENIINILQVGFDAAALFLCCAGIFHTKGIAKSKDMFLFSILFLCCMLARIKVTVGIQEAALFSPYGFEISPANSLVLLLFLILVVLLLNSIFWETKDNRSIFCGTMIVFSLYFLLRSISIFIFTIGKVSNDILYLGSRILTLFLLVLLLYTPAFHWLRQMLQNRTFITMLVSSNIAILFLAILSTFSFDIRTFLMHSRTVFVLILFLLLLDSILLYYDQRKAQERKRIHMIEQYVPIVEELISQVRARQHEFNNRMLAIEAVVHSAETMEEVKQNISMLTKGLAINPNDQELLSCDSKVIAGMLFGKLKQAESAGIDLKIELHGLFKKSVTPETEWIEIIGILLDNAIEASSKGDLIFVKSRQHDHLLEFYVSNPAAPMSNTEFMALFQKGFTTKNNPALHGFGLYNVLRMTEHYHGKIITRNEQFDKRSYVLFGVLLP